MTGATGFIGRALVKGLRLRGHQVHVLTRNVESAQRALGQEVKCHSWPQRQSLDFQKSLEKVQCIVHLAGESVAGGRWTRKRKEKILNSRIKSTQLLVSGINAGKFPELKCFIGASAIGYYGDGQEKRLTEKDPQGSGFLADVCQQWEQGLQGLPDHLRTVLIRIGLVLGGRGGFLSSVLPVFRLGLGGSLGSGQQWMSWIHLYDLKALFLEAVENPNFRGIYNGVAPQPVRNMDFTRTLARLLRRPAWFPVPAMILRILMGEMSQLLLYGQRVTTERVISQGFSFRYSKLEEALGEVLTPDDPI